MAVEIDLVDLAAPILPVQARMMTMRTSSSTTIHSQTLTSPYSSSHRLPLSPHHTPLPLSPPQHWLSPPSSSLPSSSSSASPSSRDSSSSASPAPPPPSPAPTSPAPLRALAVRRASCAVLDAVSCPVVCGAHAVSLRGGSREQASGAEGGGVQGGDSAGSRLARAGHIPAKGMS